MSSVRNAMWSRSSGLIALRAPKPTSKSLSAKFSCVAPSVTKATLPAQPPTVTRAASSDGSGSRPSTVR